MRKKSREYQLLSEHARKAVEARMRKEPQSQFLRQLAELTQKLYTFKACFYDSQQRQSLPSNERHVERASIGKKPPSPVKMKVFKTEEGPRSDPIKFRIKTNKIK